MRKALALIFALQFCLVAGAASAASASKPTLEVKQAQPTKEGVLELAETYTKSCEPKLEKQDKDAIAEVKKTLADNKFSDIFLKKALDNLISQLTLKLASAKSLDGLTVTSAYLVKEYPKNRRVLNLFGSVLHTKDKYKDSIAVFEYTQTLDKDSVLTRLNLANAYLDDNKDDKAKALLSKLEFEDSENKAVFRALATYYYKKNNAAKFREYLFKAAKFKGFKKKKAEKQQKKVDDNEVKEGESTEAMETKLKQLEDTIPLTTADIIEEDFPGAAQEIRDKYCKLGDNVRWILPKLPMVNLNGPPEFQKNEPIVDEWLKVAKGKFAALSKHLAAQSGIDVNASKKVRQQQAKAAAKKQMSESLKQAQQLLKQMENMPGVSKAQIAKAKQKLAKALKDQGIKEDESADVQMDANQIAGGDSGSLFAAENYYNFKKIQAGYGIYFMKYHKEMMAKITDIMKVYNQKVEQENDRYDDEAGALADEHAKYEGDGPGPHGANDEKCERARIGHKRHLNMISDSSYRQWSNLFMPQYAQRMKPNLDAYFNVCMLHIRNMNDPKVIEREYGIVAMTYAMYSMQSMSYIGMGESFKYHPEVEEEERELEEAIARAKEEAEAKSNQFKAEFKSPEFSWTDWITDHFVLEVSGEFLALKISPKAIEFEAYVPGIGAGAKYDFSEEKFETYTGVGMKLEVGVNVCGVGAKAEAKGDFYRRTATWDLANGTYSETDSAKAEAKGSFGPLSAGGEFELDTQLNAKATGKVSFADTLNLQGETDFK